MLKGNLRQHERHELSASAIGLVEGLIKEQEEALAIVKAYPPDAPQRNQTMRDIVETLRVMNFLLGLAQKTKRDAENKLIKSGEGKRLATVAGLGK